MRQPRLALAAAAALAGFGAFGLAPARATEAPATPEITASGLAFTPKELVVKPDTEVIWHIGAEGPDGLSHHILLDDQKADCSSESDCKKKNDSGYMGSGLDFRRTFEKLGDYAYHCKVHKSYGMVGIVRVTENGQPPATQPPPTQPPPTQPPPTTAPPTTAPPATSPPTTAPRPPSPPPAPAATTTTKPPKAPAAGKVSKPPKTATTQGPTTTTLPPETTTTAPPLALPPLAEKGPLVQAPIVESTTTTTVPAVQPGDEGFVAVNKGARRGGVKKMTYAAVGALGLSLIGGGVAWWRRRPSRYWSA